MHGYQSEGSLREDRHRRPPDYTHRSLKLRLFGLIAALMVVLAVAERASDPKTWKWFEDLDRMSADREEIPDSRLEPTPLATANDPLGTFISKADTREPLVAKADAKPAEVDPVARAWEQGWKDVYHRLEPEQRSLLFEMLYAARSGGELAPDRQNAASELIPLVTTLWEDYQAAAFQSVAQLKGDDQLHWVDVLRQVNRRFSNEVRPALQAVVDRRAPSESEEQALAGVDQTLVGIARDKIEDDTVFRPAEREIWFHELARVRDTLPSDLERAAVGKVAYVQLFKQPNDYRGQVVSIEGTVKLAYRVQAPPNYLGIEQYYVYWIHIAGGPSTPVVVYALGAPPGFPEIKDKDIDGETTKLHEDVQISGVFFKRWAYLGQNGTYTAPLIIAATPNWTPRVTIASNAAEFVTKPWGIAAVVGSALGLTLLVCLALFARGSRSTLRSQSETDLTALAKLPSLPTTQETLRQMERDARSGNQPI